ncbi:MAG: hypothetical protein J5832_02130, partial [Clostridia bacterium]|nr:hypothetical protein [Clostridia bacterium]
MKNKLLKILSIFLVMMFATALLPLAAVPAAAGWSGEGAGTDADPYKIGTATELYEFRDIVNGTHATVEKNTAACAVLTADIDLYGAAWTPIGTVDYNFTGVFDGQGHSIIGLYGVCGDAANIGLFGYVKYGTVKNLSVSGTFTASGEGDISIGGIVGTLWSGTVKNCRSTVTVRAAVEGDTSVNLVGGVVGYNLQGTVCDCYATGAIAVTYTGDYCINCVGGVVGFSVEGNVTNCYATGSVTAAGANLNHAGGVIGRLVGGTAAGCRSLYDGDVDWPYVLSDVVIGNITDATVTDCTTLTVAQFSDSDSFNGWDFENVWTMGEKCPLLKCFISAPAELSNTGSGTADDPYKIGTAAQLAEFRDIVNGTHDTVEKNQSACAVLTADVDLGNNSWAPIKSYTGTFDGQGHRITGLYVNGDLQHAGLFSRIRDGGKVQNLAVSGSVSTNRDNSNAGGIAGMNEGIIESCRSTVSVSSDNALVSLGGIVGYNYEGGIVKSCYATGNVSGGELSDAGGVAGYNYKGTVTNCYATGNVSGGEYSEVGGVVGRFAEATITNCYSTGILSGGEGSDVGGVVGMATNATVKNCYCRSGWNVVGNNIDDSSTVTDCAVLTVMQFTDSANFVGFDFTNTWYMGASTPQLKCFIPAPAGLLETGSGTADDPYKIGTAAQLAEFRDIVNGTHMTAEKNAAACAVLTADVDLGGEEWTPIGTDSYTGTFDGQGRSIKGLYVSNQYMYFGLFGCVGEGGTVKNLTVGGTINTQDASTSSEDVKAGGVVGFLSKGTVENCRSTVTVTVVSDPAYILAGGVVGHTTKGTITNCCATGAVSASGGGDANIAGGVVGYNIQGSVTNCCATGAVSASGSSEDNYAG